MINLTTGPIALHQEVTEALSAPSISHRSPEFKQLHQEIVDTMCQHLNTKETFVLQGSGTLANEVMIWQIKLLGGQGIIMSNGEFGLRLTEQSERAKLNFVAHAIPWGEEYLLRDIELLLDSTNPDWILFTHCETSTGIENNLEAIAKIAHKRNCKVFVDCISSIGTKPIDLSHVAMATGSSGKGLCSLSGIALVFSNIKPLGNSEIPKYFDLQIYESNEGIPFTLSSNQLKALHVSIKKTMNVDCWKGKDTYAEKIYSALQPFGIIPFATKESRVFTIVQSEVNSEDLYLKLSQSGVLLSCQSRYLRERNWIQLTLLGLHEEHEIDFVIEALKEALHLTKNSEHLHLEECTHTIA
ncbi:alanine--glyoxylate aminotransferase family protein [Pontibacter sp. JH31]|uniref:Alanine--glyoxylate aminotransferase family protein n=1 Tax=Pontibacter aquaedesilientis TaxID=2766980 RepID=A0ABR7XI22_9BACT|nr:aminotransferase class V-fold PLP-dependent enzyme [Pontibacter aquaedesilientis]MBD1397898.1 alanine--glyoxylate aminotransferase family protein [Pontibacter aquaedesilientis]